MMLILLRIRAWWLSCSIHHAQYEIARQEEQLEQDTALYLAKLERLRKMRVAISTQSSPTVVLTEAIVEADRKKGLL